MADHESALSPRPSADSLDVIGLVLDARKPVSTFVKLVADRNTSGDCARSLRKRAREQLYTLPSTETPYGKILETSTIQGKHGLLHWDHVNMFAWSYYCAPVSTDFFRLIMLAM